LEDMDAYANPLLLIALPVGLLLFLAGRRLAGRLEGRAARGVGSAAGHLGPALRQRKGPQKGRIPGKTLEELKSLGYLK